MSDIKEARSSIIKSNISTDQMVTDGTKTSQYQFKNSKQTQKSPKGAWMDTKGIKTDLIRINLKKVDNSNNYQLLYQIKMTN